MSRDGNLLVIATLFVAVMVFLIGLQQRSLTMMLLAGLGVVAAIILAER